jgi:hypothetical protein
VTACTTTSVSYASATTGSQTVAGTISQALLIGAVGQMIAISNNQGRLAYWNTTSLAWLYVGDDTAV